MKMDELWERLQKVEKNEDARGFYNEIHLLIRLSRSKICKMIVFEVAGLLAENGLSLQPNH